MDLKDSFMMLIYKGDFIHSCQNRTTGKEEITSLITLKGTHTYTTHKTIAGAKRFITMFQSHTAA